MCKGPECLYLGKTFHINTFLNPKQISKQTQTSGKPQVWVSCSENEALRCPGTPGTSRACGPTQPSGSRSPYRPPPQQHQPCTPKGSVQALSSGLTRPASSPPSPSQAQVPPSACSPRVPGVRKGWRTLTWDRRVTLSLLGSLLPGSLE